VGDVDELTEYQHRRLELADMLRAALYIARGRRDEEAEEQARRLLVRLAEDRFQLAVVGQFSRGKSTLMNAVLGQAYLPTGALPMTSVVTTVRYGSRLRATARRRGSAAAVEVPLAELARYVAQASAERSHLQVAAVDVEVPAEVLRLGFTFVDTPGVGSAYEANTATTRRFLPEADAVIFVTGFDSALTGVELEFLAEAARHAGKLFLVINKRDLVSDADASEVLRFVGRRLGEDVHLHGSRVFALSALRALQARLDGDAERLADSGLPALQDALVEFLTTQKAGVLLTNVAGRAAGLIARQRRDLLLGRLRGGDGPDPDTVASAFETRLGDLYSQQQVVADKLTDKVGAGPCPLILDT
jgi:GTPase SAR1 family protein